MHPVIESIRRISVEKFYASRGQMQSISAQNGEVSVLSEQFFFSENCDLFVNMHLYRPPFALPEPKPPQLHKHDFYEIVFVYAGNAVNTVQSGGKLTRLAMGQGDICLLNPNAEHRLEIGSEEDTVLNILVKKQFFNLGFQEAIGQNNLLHSFFTDSLFEKKAVDHYLYFENRLCPGMKDSAFALAAESARGDIDSPVKLKGYLFLLFADPVSYTHLANTGESCWNNAVVRTHRKLPGILNPNVYFSRVLCDAPILPPQTVTCVLSIFSHR